MFQLLLIGCFAPAGSLLPLPPRPEDRPPVDTGEGVEHVRPQLRPPPPPWPEPTDEPEEPEPPADGAVLYAAGVIHDLRIELSTEAIDSLRVEPTREVSARVTFEDEDLRVALRLKGTSSFRTIDQKPSFKIDVHEYDDAQRIDGEKRLTLHNMIQDPTMVREHTYYWLAERLGIPTPRFSYARVWVNGEPYGLYGLIETMDSELIEHVFPEPDEGGNLYESSGADFTHARDWFKLEESGDLLPTPDDIEDLVDALEDARDADWWSVVEDEFALGPTLSYWALDIAAGNDDGYVFNRHNYLVYHAPSAGNWSFLPWGTDRSFSREVPPRGDTDTPLAGALVIRCWADAACAEALTGRLHEVLDIWETELPSALEGTLDLIEDACEDDPRREYSCQPDHIRSFVEDRADFLRGWM